MSQLNQTFDFTFSTTVSIDTIFNTLPRKLMLVVFTYISRSVPLAGPVSTGALLCVVFGTRTGEGGEEPMGGVSSDSGPQAFSYLEGTEGGLSLGLRTLRKPTQGLPKARIWLLLRRTCETERGWFLLLGLGTKGNWRN